jgi:16S rRNA (cytosine1402-N4)-methyltransferase
MTHKPLHTPVLLKEVLQTLNPQSHQTIVDCTLGLAGHSTALLPHLSPGGTLLGLDLDPHNLELAKTTLEPLAQKTNTTLHLLQSNFAALPALLAKLNLQKAHAILADVGVASTQIDDPTRGFSYRHPGPLDMRMDPTRGQPASALVNRLSEKELTQSLLELGDETDAPQIAKLIVEHRKHQPITTTEQLTKIVCEARDFTLKRAAGAKLHPAARTFQALRILVNRELANLDRLLAVVPQCLHPNGTAAIITFHSGEDRRVKQSFKNLHRAGTYSEISPDPVTATEQEQRSNPRSRSAKLRWARLSPSPVLGRGSG